MPDVFTKAKRSAVMAAKNRAFWKAKLSRNAQRDRGVTRVLRTSGWKVLRIWECALVRSRAGHTLARVVRALARTGVGPKTDRRAGVGGAGSRP